MCMYILSDYTILSIDIYLQRGREGPDGHLYLLKHQTQAEERTQEGGGEGEERNARIKECFRWTCWCVEQEREKVKNESEGLYTVRNDVL